MVLPRADGTGFFTTEKPDRVYKTERGARQAERMFQNPERYAGWQKENWAENQTLEPEPSPIPEPEPIPEIEPIEEDPFIVWYQLPRDIQDMIHESQSIYKCVEELISNGWTGVHLSSIIEDFGSIIAERYFPEFF